jgi:hypothetical protein
VNRTEKNTKYIKLAIELVDDQSIANKLLIEEWQQLINGFFFDSQAQLEN